MRQYQNHLIDPTFFYDAIEEFAFDYDLYRLDKTTKYDEEGKAINSWQHCVIRGSFQRHDLSKSRSKTGSIQSQTADFYCKSLYRINLDDILEYQNTYYIVTDVSNYDEFGVRSCSLKMIELTKYRDLRDYIMYLRGEKLV